MGAAKFQVLLCGIALRARGILVLVMGRGSMEDWIHLLGPLFRVGRLVCREDGEEMPPLHSMPLRKQGASEEAEAGHVPARQAAEEWLRENGLLGAGEALEPERVERLGVCEGAWYPGKLAQVYLVDCGEAGELSADI